ncbi:MAG: hypothetical protein RBR08_10230 [Desulforegulaceae bacterium]|nr:hypothetical protein [Desulforegulaceae bacterium]
MENLLNLKAQKKLGRKHIKSFASGIAFKFSASCYHYAWLAYKNQIRNVSINLFTIEIKPEIFNIERNRILADMLRETLLECIKKLAPPANIISAFLKLEFGIDEFIETENGMKIGMSFFTAELFDDRGKKWSVTHIEKTTLLNP